MSARKNGEAVDCVAIDLNTQFDFCDAQGAFPVANLRHVLPSLKAVMVWVEANGIPVVSSLDSHRRWEIERAGVPVHCVDGSPGQRKLGFTLLRSHKLIEGDNTLWAPIDIFDSCRQVIFRKRTRDFFANPKADRFLTQLPAKQYLVFGVGVENSVKNIALGLLARGRCVSVVPEACGYWNRAESDLALRQMEAKGARLVALAELSQWSFSRRRRSWIEDIENLPAPADSPRGAGLPALPISRRLLVEKNRSGQPPRNGSGSNGSNGHGSGSNGHSRG